MNKLWVLDDPSKSITINSYASATIDLEYTVHYADVMLSSFNERSRTGVFNSTEVTAVFPPIIEHSIVIRNFTVFNPNSEDVIVNINLLISGLYYNLDTFVLSTNESYSSNGCLTSTGRLKFES